MVDWTPEEKIGDILYALVSLKGCIPFKQLKFNKNNNYNNNKSHFLFTKGAVLKCNLDCSSKCTLMEILFQQISIPRTICTSHIISLVERRENKRTNNRTMLPVLKSNVAAGYQGPVETDI